MKKQYLIFAILENLILEENTTFDFCGYTISNNINSFFKQFPDIQKFTTSVGSILTSEFFTKCFACVMIEYDNENQNDLLAYEGGRLRSLLQLIWLMEDNSVFNSINYSINMENSNTIINRGNLFFSNSKGLYEPLLLDNEKINIIENDKLLDENSKIIYRFYNELEYTTDGRFHKPHLEKYYIDKTRLQRSLSLLLIARTTSFLPMKIGFYINTLECLLLTVESELSFRLRLYAANFIGNSKSEKEEISNIINKAYSIRSKYFHGENLTSKITDNLQNISQQMDVIVRKVMKKAIIHSDIINDNNKLNEYFNSILFD